MLQTAQSQEFQTQQTQANQQFQAQQAEKSFENQKLLLAEQDKYKQQNIPTSIITDSATGKQSLINNQT
jgi:hypothetical protein